MNGFHIPGYSFYLPFKYYYHSEYHNCYVFIQRRFRIYFFKNTWYFSHHLNKSTSRSPTESSNSWCWQWPCDMSTENGWIISWGIQHRWKTLTQRTWQDVRIWKRQDTCQQNKTGDKDKEHWEKQKTTKRIGHDWSCVPMPILPYYLAYQKETYLAFQCPYYLAI